MIRTTFGILLCCLSCSSLYASSLYDHRAVCNNDRACMEKQVTANSLWHNQKWDYNFKNACKHFVTNYPKDYVKAVDCMQDLQLKDSEIQKNTNEKVRNKKNSYKVIIRRDRLPLL